MYQSLKIAKVSLSYNIYTVTRRLVGESRLRKKKTCESEWGHLIFQDQPLASLVKMGSFYGLFPFLQIHSRSSDLLLVLERFFKRFWKKEIESLT